jgi:hypothetical protein
MLLPPITGHTEEKVVIEKANTTCAEIKSPEWVPLFVFDYVEALKAAAAKQQGGTK